MRSDERVALDLYFDLGQERRSAAAAALLGRAGDAEVGLARLSLPCQFQCFRGGFSIEVGLYLFPEASGSTEDAAGDHDVHVGTGVDGADVVNQEADLRRVGGLAANNEEDVGLELAHDRADFIVGDAPTKEIHVPAICLEEVGTHLGTEFLRFAVGAGDENPLADRLIAGQVGLEVLSDRAIDPSGHMLGGKIDAIFAVELLDVLHRRPDEVVIEGTRVGSPVEFKLDELAASLSVALK
jgi:hypothetical protein